MTEHSIYGIHAVTALLANKNRAIKMIYINQNRNDDRFQAVLTQASLRQIPVERLSLQEMNQRFADFTHQGVVALAGRAPEYSEHDIPSLVKDGKEPGLFLILDGITDPHNLGACLRSADAAGVNFVIVPKDKSATVTPVVSKTACGATETVILVRATNLARAINILKELGVWIYGAAGEASGSLYEMDCRIPTALILGAEGKGMRRLTRDLCDRLFSIPMLGAVSSLNVSVAAGVSLYEAVRQRQS